MSLGDTDNLWNTIDRLAPDSSAREIVSAIILAAFDCVSIVLKRSDTLSTFPEPITEVNLYQSLLVNRIPSLLSVRKDKHSLLQDEIEFLILEACTKLDPILLNLNVTSLDDGSVLKDFRQDFLCAMVKVGLLSPEGPARILGVQTGEIPPLLNVMEIVDEASDVMDEEGGIQRILERLREVEGNQSVVVEAIIEVSLQRDVGVDDSWFNPGYRSIIFIR